MSSDTSSQKLTPSPARNAVPLTVTSLILGTSTGIPLTLAWNCIKNRLAVGPPSTISFPTRRPESASMQCRTSSTWYAIDSNVALTMLAGFVPSVIPTMRPLADESQYGAAKPTNAGTKKTPPLLGFDEPSLSDSLGFLIIPIPFTSQSMADPAVYTPPSSA